MAEEATPAAETNDAPAADAPKGELKGALLNADQVASWGNDTVIVEKTPVTEADALKVAEETPAEEETAAETTETPEIVAPEPEIAAVEDPGDYQPKDYGFDVTVYDAEGKNGRVRHIDSVDAWDSFLETDPNFGNAKELMKAQRLATKMETAQERDKEAYDARKAAYDDYAQNEQTREAATNQIANEIQYLVDRGDLPPVAPEFANADWSDPKIAAQPGVREQIALLSAMAKENAARAKAGLAPMTSALDAWNALRLDQARQTNSTRAQQAAEQRRAAGARVAGTSPNPVTVAPKGIAIGRGGSLNDLGANNWEV